ncbi:hypothetical protein RUND412_002656 [Rhizina undulata]
MPSASDGADDVSLSGDAGASGKNSALYFDPFAAIPMAKSISDRPLLLPTGRKLRHLNGIAIRNLLTQKPNISSSMSVATATPPGRQRGWSTNNKGKSAAQDDDFVAGTWRSPGKISYLESIVAIEEEEGGPSSRGLSHSKSHTDLASAAAGAGSPTHASGDGYFDTVDVAAINNAATGRPATARLRSRSNRGNPLGLESPRLREKRLGEVFTARMVDTFFSLHRAGSAVDEKPIYVSEVIAKSMNPTFQYFDLTLCGPAISRLDAVMVKVWIRSREEIFRLLVEMDIQLKSLQFLGKNLENFAHPLPSNCIVFFLSDGCYASFTDMPPRDVPAPDMWKNPPLVDPNIQPTSSYDSLMKLSTLEDCIYDALSTTAKISSQINNILSSKSSSINLVKKNSEARARRDDVLKALALEKKRLEAAIKHREAFKKSLAARREGTRVERERMQTAERHLEGATQKLERCKEDLAKTRAELEGQRRRIVEDLSSIYPIDPMPNETLGFTIRGLHLPNDNHEEHDEESVAAALGYTAHMVYLLGFYLGQYLRYPIKPLGSNSFLKDPISIIQGPRTFPLWIKGSIYYRFEYGVFLLNKDIEQLLNSRSILVMDLRHTLPNLKYLLLCITTSDKPLPERELPSSPFVRMLRRPSGRSILSSASSPTDSADEASIKSRRKAGRKKMSIHRMHLPEGTVEVERKHAEISPEVTYPVAGKRIDV